MTEEVKSAPPFNLTIMFGIKNVAITRLGILFQYFTLLMLISTHRDFANFCLTSEVGKALRLWLQVLIYFKA